MANSFIKIDFETMMQVIKLKHYIGPLNVNTSTNVLRPLCNKSLPQI